MATGERGGGRDTWGQHGGPPLPPPGAARAVRGRAAGGAVGVGRQRRASAGLPSAAGGGGGCDRQGRCAAAINN